MIRRVLVKAVDGTVRHDRGVPLVARDHVMKIFSRIRPVPLRDDDVPFRAFRARGRLLRIVPGCNPIGPVRKHLERALTPELAHLLVHLRAVMSRRDAARPRRHARIELAERGRDFARGPVAELMARHAAIGLELFQKLALTPSRGRSLLLERELALVGQLEQRQPVVRWIVLGRGARIRRDDSLQIQRLAGRGRHLRRIDEAVAPDEHLVVRFRQIRDDIASTIVGDDDPAEARRQFLGFGNHPDAGLRSLGARHHAADVVGIDQDGVPTPLPRPHTRDGRSQQSGDANSRIQNFSHGRTPVCAES